MSEELPGGGVFEGGCFLLNALVDLAGQSSADERPGSARLQGVLRIVAFRGWKKRSRKVF